MPEPPKVPALKALSPAMRVDVMISDWRGEILPELPTEEKERQLYAKAWEAYLEGDYGFGLWCWHETDRLTNALNGSVREVTRVLGQERFLGFSHRRALAEAVPLEKVYRPRKGDMSRPRVDAIMLPSYQLLCVYAVRARSGDVKAKAQLEIALGELAERSRADPFVKHFESFQRLLDRSTKAAASAPDPAGSPPH